MGGDDHMQDGLTCYPDTETDEVGCVLCLLWPAFQHEGVHYTLHEAVRDGLAEGEM